MKRFHRCDGVGYGLDGSPGMLAADPGRDGAALCDRGLEGSAVDGEAACGRWRAAAALEGKDFVGAHPGQVGGDDQRCSAEELARPQGVGGSLLVDPGQCRGGRGLSVVMITDRVHGRDDVPVLENPQAPHQ